jgi:hypothetical protein
MGLEMRRDLIPSLLLFLVANACGGGGSDSGGPPASANTGGTGAATGGASGSSATGGGGTAGKGTSGGAGGTDTGSGGTGGTGTGGSATGGASGNAGTSNGGGGAVAPSVQDCPTAQMAGTPLRRLTRFEYANSVRDLLGVDPAPAADLPADEVTNSFDNNAQVLTVSALHAEKYVLVSEALAKQAVQNLAALTSCDTAATGEEGCALAFARSFGRRAFRRPLTAADETMLMAAYAAGKTGGTHAEGIEVMIRAALQSSDFLFRLETTSPPDAAAALVPLSQYELATRLSYLVWSSGPDDALLDAAAAGALATPAAVAAKAREMLASPRARGAIAHFFEQWTGTTRLDIVSKHTGMFPTFTPELKAGMQAELPAFIEHVMWTGDHLLSTLFTSQSTFVTRELASLYGVTPPAGSDLAPVLVALPADQGRAGILTQPGFLSVQGHPDQTSPVLRGKFVRSMLLCDPPDPPPDDVNITVPNIDQGGTARERFSAHLTAGASCNGCHTGMDPIGLAFENFDAIGQYRTMENGEPIDASGEIFDANDPLLAGPFDGVLEMAQKLAGSVQVRDCMATQWFRFTVGRTEVQPDSCSLATLQVAFGASGGDLAELVVGVTQTDAFLYRAPVTP